jgi:hypothetical protein
MTQPDEIFKLTNPQTIRLLRAKQYELEHEVSHGQNWAGTTQLKADIALLCNLLATHLERDPAEGDTSNTPRPPTK